VEIYGDNTTETLPWNGERGNSYTLVHGDNSTKIDGDDNYTLGGTGYTSIKGDNHTSIEGTDDYVAVKALSFVGVAESNIGASAEVYGAHLEVALFHVEANVVTLKDEGTKFCKDHLVIMSLG